MERMEFVRLLNEYLEARIAMVRECIERQRLIARTSSGGWYVRVGPLVIAWALEEHGPRKRLYILWRDFRRTLVKVL
jgi:hypothetical protein